MKDIYIFTYGTLKRGFKNHYLLLDDATFVSNAITCEKYQMYPCINKSFPFLIKSEKVQQIRGEVFKTSSSELLDVLDFLEGYPNLYIKKIIDVELENKDIVKALVYVKNEDTNLNSVDYTTPLNEWSDNFNTFIV
ncbi:MULTISPECIES: gamma-glutamylcyclotransferase family protein [Aliarcobacter]|jgi:gamma-glutamylaminecyclotransferase|uniref:gamma-glutamylcyclotransferase family protein n=1 Tax=Aliarcobacter TaxID=2321111 RepID=UPI0021B2F1AA|nr:MULTISPECIES: gamma-glutamylcyclotransferase family protein [Aliarcobacter]MCT7540363.1 gamma-glutamylcyclotransferase [Aliarcobacter cryaerophilus]MCT7646755.1 gamma-glutamylcyclotransferase [Aliarcobacter butzleri]